MSGQEIQQLVEIAKMLRDRDLAELAAHQAARHRARAASKDFSEQAAQEDAATLNDFGYRRDHELPRRAWRERRMYALSHYEARAAALAEAQKRVAAKSFGRAMVLEQIAERLKDRSKP